MTRHLIGSPEARPLTWGEGDPVAPRESWLLGLGCEPGPIVFDQAEAKHRIPRLWNLRGESLDRWNRIIEGSGIESRCTVLPVEEIITMSTAQRMSAYETHAPGLAAEAATRALDDAGLTATDVTDLIVVSCTGFSAPGVDVALVERLGLRRDVRRCIIGFMGCFGGVTGLRQAAMIARADPGATVLVVCIELCSLHLRPDTSDENLVATALFADGAGAAVVGGRSGGNASEGRAAGNRGRLTLGAGRLLAPDREGMSWRITDAGFAMTLSREVPALLKRAILEFVDDEVQTPPRSFVVHPGGPGILEAVDAGLNLDGAGGLEHSRAVLRANGNMSSGTVLFVLAAALRAEALKPIMLLAFGPGLSLEGISLFESATGKENGA